MPHVIPADAEKFSIYKTIESKVKRLVAYRMRQCDMLSVPESTSFTWRLSVKTASEKQRFIIVGFQTDKDVSKQKEKHISSVVDIQINANFTENVPDNTRAFALVISDKMSSFQSDGNRMSIVS